MRLVIARCSVDYVGRLTAHLPSALRLPIVEAARAATGQGGESVPATLRGSPIGGQHR